MNQPTVSEYPFEATSAEHVTDDAFVRRFIHRQVARLISFSSFTDADRHDLIQEVYARAARSLSMFDPSIGHPYPYLATIVVRHLATILRDRNVAKRANAERVSLSQIVPNDDGSQTELSQLLNENDQDRRLSRHRRFSEEELTDLRIDMQSLMDKLPQKYRDLLERRRTHSISEISQELGIPRSTLNDWMLHIRKEFEEAGFLKYLDD